MDVLKAIGLGVLFIGIMFFNFYIDTFFTNLGLDFFGFKE